MTMNPKPLVKAIIYALAYQRIGRRAYSLGLYVTPGGMVLL
jgi:hypothetical protein